MCRAVIVTILMWAQLSVAAHSFDWAIPHHTARSTSLNVGGDCDGVVADLLPAG
jgi:hypothetical protein